jgi:uncharacterized protein
MVFLLPLLGYLAAIVAIGSVSTFIVLPLLLAATAAVVQATSTSNNKDDNSVRLQHSALLTGRVWHTRFHPKRHAFTYPIFMFALDLAELEAFRNKLWPLVPFLLNIRPTEDHLKNGEGRTTKNTTTKSTESTTIDDNKSDDDSFLERIFRLVAERTNNKFQPNSATHRVTLLTHLCYYGYNFNPVSFYSIINKSSHTIEAMVGEVSNTPWMEMYCYVLHPDGMDQVQVEETTQKDTAASTQNIFYSFPKSFHVSPFMEMDYWYDWTFAGEPQKQHPTTFESSGNKGKITVVNTLRWRNSNNQIEFTAKLILEPQKSSSSLSPWTVAWQLIRFPTFCVLIQLWIHYQAVWLFVRGIVYIPHPQGSETVASKMIATIMVPFFAVRDYVSNNNKQKSKAE